MVTKNPMETGGEGERRMIFGICWEEGGNRMEERADEKSHRTQVGHQTLKPLVLWSPPAELRGRFSEELESSPMPAGASGQHAGACVGGGRRWLVAGDGPSRAAKERLRG